MSVALFTAVWKRRDLAPNEKIVLLKLADCANADGGSCFPTLRTIAADAALHPRSVRRILAALIGRGIVSRGLCKGDRRRHGYQLHLGAKLSPISTPEIGDIGDTNRGHQRSEIGDTHDPLSLEPSVIRQSDQPRTRDWFTECRELHGLTCNGGGQHRLVMWLAREKAKRQA